MQIENKNVWTEKRESSIEQHKNRVFVTWLGLVQLCHVSDKQGIQK